MERYGIVLSAVRDGQLWRLPAGVFFHAGLAHCLNNAFLLLFFGTVAWVLPGPALSITVFMLGCVTGAAIQMCLGTIRYDSFLGISSGVFALYGVLTALAVFERRTLPRGFTFLLLGIVTISGVGTELLSTNAASIGHVAGLAFGAVSAVAIQSARVLSLRPVAGVASLRR